MPRLTALALTALVTAALAAASPAAAQGRDSTRRDSTMRDSSMMRMRDSSMMTMRHDSAMRRMHEDSAMMRMHHDSGMMQMRHDSSAMHGAMKTGLPPGTYRSTITLANTPRTMKRAERDSLVGAWQIQIDSADHYIVRYKDHEVATGVMQGLSGHRVAFDNQDSGEYACHEPATYHYVLGTRRITFHKVGTDACAGRAAVLTAHAWVRR